MSTGAVAAGGKVPSVRELAEKAGNNTEHYTRAYKELEAEGYIYSVQAKGSFAARRHGGTKIRKDGGANKDSQGNRLLSLSTGPVRAE
jgi:GntR family transcriptional regulator